MQIRNIVKDELLKFAVKSGRVILSVDDCDEFAKLVEEKFKSTNSKSMPFNTASCFDSSCLHYKTHRGCELEQCSRC